MKSIKDMLTLGINRLGESSVEDALTDARVLMCHTLGFDRIKLHMSLDMEMEESKQSYYLSCIEKRADNIPVAYIIGEKEFMGLDFIVNEDVLIPRPDTEILVEQALSLYKDKAKFNALDLCTGSGCIGISISHYNNNASFTLSDISTSSLEVAKKNVQKHHLDDRISLIRSDLFKHIEGKFDLIVSNPPYINEADMHTLSSDVLNEPHLALYGGEDGLDFYRKIICSAKSHLNDGAYLIVEVGYDQGQAVQNLFKENEFFEITIKSDYSGLDRIVYGRYNI